MKQEQLETPLAAKLVTYSLVQSNLNKSILKKKKFSHIYLRFSGTETAAKASLLLLFTFFQ